MPVAPERTGWRDEGISREHRKWGIGCTFLDFDFFGIEYEFGNPKLLVEYKNEHAEMQSAANPRYQALIKLGNAAQIPVIGCRYKDDFSEFRPVPLNDYAKQYIKEIKWISKEAWITLLYTIKGHEVTPEFLASMEIEI